MPDEKGGASEEKPKRRRLNTDQKRAMRVAEVANFVKAYGRRAQKGCEPNDRRYDREIRNKIKRLPPAEFDRLLRDEEE